MKQANETPTPPAEDRPAPTKRPRKKPCVDGSLLARELLDVDAVLVGAAMCSAC